jgi:hypothetical protein
MEKYETTRKSLQKASATLKELAEEIEKISERPLIDPRGLSDILYKIENIHANILYVLPLLANYALDTALLAKNGNIEKNIEEAHDSTTRLLEEMFKKDNEENSKGL